MKKAYIYKITWNCAGVVLKDYYKAQNKQEAINKHKNIYGNNIISIERL